MRGAKVKFRYSSEAKAKKMVEKLQKEGYVSWYNENNVVFYRNKPKKAQRKPVRDYASQKFLEQKRREKLQDRIWKLFGLWMLLVVATITVSAEHPDRVFAQDFDVNLAPVRFTEQELANLQKRVEQKAEQEKLSAYTNVEKVIAKYFGKDTDWALRCLKSENARHNPYAVNVNRNKTQDIGIFQVNTPVHCGKVGKNISVEECRKQLMDVETNVRVAKQIFDGSGKNAWYGKTCR